MTLEKKIERIINRYKENTNEFKKGVRQAMSEKNEAEYSSTMSAMYLISIDTQLAIVASYLKELVSKQNDS
jgi:cytolysin (calcineurin-like family phosphatase)